MGKVWNVIDFKCDITTSESAALYQINPVHTYTSHSVEIYSKALRTKIAPFLDAESLRVWKGT
jgi:hypothetical protein